MLGTRTFLSHFSHLYACRYNLQLRSKHHKCWVHFLELGPVHWYDRQALLRDEQHSENTEMWIRCFTSNSKATLTRKKEKSDYKPVPIRQTWELNSFQLTSCLGNGSPEALWEEESMSLPYRKTLDIVFLYSYNTRVKSQPRCCPYLAKLGSSTCRRWVNLASDRNCLFEALPWDLPNYSFEYIWRSRNFYLCSFHKR